MIKKVLPFIVVIVLIGCKTNTFTVDYFGQSEPESTPVIFGEDIIPKKNRFEHGISLTPNGRELAFGILDENADRGKIFYSQKIKDKWTSPQNFKPLGNGSVFLPYFTPDGKSLLYAQSIPDTNNFYITDIWTLERIIGNWGPPIKLPAPLSSISRETTASMTNDGTIYFSSNR